jgi:hypothetical protein
MNLRYRKRRGRCEFALRPLLFSSRVIGLLRGEEAVALDGAVRWRRRRRHVLGSRSGIVVRRRR